MSKHLFGLVVTPYGAAANNRGDNEGSNISTLQKLLWRGEVHTTVSAEAIRWALRYYWEKHGSEVNRRWNEEKYDHDWRDQTWAPWTSLDEDKRKQMTYIDDDILGFMLAEAGNTDGNDVLDALKSDKKKADLELKGLSKDDKKTEAGKNLSEKVKDLHQKIELMSKGKTDKRRGALEVARAISLSPFAGDVTFNSKSGSSKTNTSLYGTEVHATRYQYGVALTPESLRVQSRVLNVIEAIISLREVGGNHSRFLFDFSPSSVIFRWTDDFAPRMLYGFEMTEDGKLSMPAIIRKVVSGDLNPAELFIGGEVIETMGSDEKNLLKQAELSLGVREISQKLQSRIKTDLAVSGS